MAGAESSGRRGEVTLDLSAKLRMTGPLEQRPALALAVERVRS